MERLPAMMRRFMQRLRWYVPYIGVALVILGPLLAPGYIFALDMVFTPVMPMPAAVTASYIPQIGMHYASLVVPAWLLQKLLLFGVLVGSGIGAHRLLAMWQPPRRLADWRAAQYIGGLLYMVNPFVYSRFMAGQYYVLLGYMLLPFFARALWQFMVRPGRVAMLRLAGIGVAISMASLHVSGMALLLAITACLVVIICRRTDRLWLRAFVVYGAGTVSLLFLLSWYWVWALVQGHGAAAVMRNFTGADRAAFATVGNGMGVSGAIASLQGFWADVQQVYIAPQDIFGWWWLPICFIWLLVIAGVAYGWRRTRIITVVALLTAGCAAFLAVGTPWNDWLAGHVPLFAGYREPQKFVAVIALAYVWFSAMAVFGLLGLLRTRSVHQSYGVGLYCFVVMLPFTIAPLMVWGFHGQLRSASYPADWYAVSRILRAAGQPAVVVLPWHAYMRTGFTGMVTANPARHFFATDIIASTDPEFAGAAAYETPAVARDVGRLLAASASSGNLASQLASRNIEYVMVLKESDYHRYSYVVTQPDIQLLFDGPTVQLYKVGEQP